MGTRRANDNFNASSGGAPRNAGFAACLWLLYLSGLWIAWRFWDRPNLESWPEAMFLGLTLMTATWSACWKIPCQNVFLASLLIALFSLGIEAVGISSGFARIDYGRRMGAQLFGLVPWMMGVVWVTFVWMSRGVAQVILVRSEGRKNYGLWVMGATISLVMLLFVGLGPTAMLKGYWGMRDGGIAGLNSGIIALRGLLVVFLLVLITPLLIRKKPAPSPLLREPLVVWIGVNLVLLSGAAAGQAWLVFWLIAAKVVTVCAWAVRSRRSAHY